MRIAVFGATGMAGSAIHVEALTRGHQVVAVSRHLTSDASNDAQLTVRAADVAVLTIRLPRGEEDRLAPLTRGFLNAAARHDTRVLIVGGSAPLRSPSHPDLLLIDDPDHVPDAWRAIAQASLDQYRSCQKHPYDGWVYVSPPAVFEPGERNGSYQRGTTTLLTDERDVSHITAPDFAIAVLDELENPSEVHHFTVNQGPAR